MHFCWNHREDLLAIAMMTGGERDNQRVAIRKAHYFSKAYFKSPFINTRQPRKYSQNLFIRPP